MTTPKKYRPSWPLVIALVLIAAVWVGGSVWSYAEQKALAEFKNFEIPALLPLVIDGLAVAMAAVAWAASLDGRPAIQARIAAVVAVAASAVSNGTWAEERSHGDVATIALAVAVPFAAAIAFEVLLAEIRTQVQRFRGAAARVNIPHLRLLQLGLSPWKTFFEWRRLALTAMDLRAQFEAAAKAAQVRPDTRGQQMAGEADTPPVIDRTPVTIPAVTATVIQRTPVADVPAIEADTKPVTDDRRMTEPVATETVTAPVTDMDIHVRPVTAETDMDTDTGVRETTATVTEISVAKSVTNGHRVTDKMTGPTVKLKPFGKPEVATRVAAMLKRKPAISAAEVASRLDISDRTARRYLSDLRGQNGGGNDRPVTGQADTADDDQERVLAANFGHRRDLIGVSA